jgi:curved DNA-binding protein CbpA
MLQPLLPYTPERDVYRLLGVPSTASTEEITVAIRRLARTFHPDRNVSTRATAEMQVVNAVRQVLVNPQARAIYDRERYRFHAGAAAARPRPIPGPQPVAPITIEPSASPVGRYLRALLLGLAAMARSLAPARCAGCRAVITGDDAYCAACGTPLLTGGG